MTTGLQRYLESLAYAPHQRRPPPSGAPGGHLPIVTISRQTGTGAHAVAEELVTRLEARTPSAAPPWTLFDRNLVAQVLEDHGLPEQLSRFMPEDRVSEIADSLDELFGVHPATRTLVRKTADTILRLAELGNVVVIGRGANILTGGLGYALHVRLVGSVQRRVERIQEQLHLDPSAAADYVHRTDLGRSRYVKKYFGKDIDDPLLYDVVINTDRISSAEAAGIVEEAVSARTLAASG